MNILISTRVLLHFQHHRLFCFSEVYLDITMLVMRFGNVSLVNLLYYSISVLASLIPILVSLTFPDLLIIPVYCGVVFYVLS